MMAVYLKVYGQLTLKTCPPGESFSPIYGSELRPAERHCCFHLTNAAVDERKQLSIVRLHHYGEKPETTLKNNKEYIKNTSIV